MTPAERYLNAAGQAGKLLNYSKEEAMDCGWCIYLELEHPSGEVVQAYRYSLHGHSRAIGNDDWPLLSPNQLDRLPLEGGPECKPYSYESEPDSD